MIDRHDSPEETSGENSISYPIPNPEDLVVIELVDARPQHYQPIEIDTPHSENSRTGLNLRLTWQGPSSSDPTKMVRVYTGPRTNQDVYNYALEYSAESNAGPIFVRSYLERRDSYAPLPKAQPLTGVTTIRLVNGGTGYPANTTVQIDGTGTGATAKAVVVDGVIQLVRITSEGTGYAEDPDVTFIGVGGTGGVATASIQPATAYLVKEEVRKITEEVPEMNRGWNEAMLGGLFVRVIRTYETLPGPWIPDSRWDDNLGPIHIEKRAVLKTTPQQEATSSPTDKRIFQSRDGSSVVSMEIFESWGDAPYDHKFSVSIPDRIPPEFRDLLPTRVIEQTEVGLAEEPVLGAGELESTSAEVNKFWRHQTVTGRDLTLLPITRHDFDLDEIQAGGSGFGGVFDNARTLAEGTLDVEEGFLITKSSVIDLGNNLKLRETKRLGGSLPARLLLTFPGGGFSSPPAVVFTGGDVGDGAEGTAVLSTVPVIPPTGEPGGIFALNFTGFGDSAGLFNFIGSRYNGGVWRNPLTAGNIAIAAASHSSNPISQATLAKLVDRSAADRITVIPRPGGSHYIAFDIGVGKKLKPNLITIRQALQLASGARMRNLRVEGFNNFVSGTILGPDVPIPQHAGDWSQAPLDNTDGYRYFRIYGTDDAIPDSHPEIFPPLVLAEIELYGELTIEAGIQLQYSFDGDTYGAFNYLGALGNGGVWRNPQTFDDIDVAVDALVTGTVDQLVDRQPSNVIQDAGTSRAYYFDLKEGRSLACDKISFRQRTGFNATAADVQLQGTNDPTFVTFDWDPLVNFVTPAAKDTWKSVDVPEGGTYRRFRLISSTANFAMGEMELYGALTFPDTAPTPTFSIGSVTIVDGGSGYAIAPLVTFEGDGIDAAGIAVINDDGVVTGVTMTNNGSGYTSEPDVIFTSVGLAGSGAAATAIIDGEVVDVTVDDGGSGYLVPPDVVFDGGPGNSGTFAAADAVLGFGLDSVTIDDASSGYADAPDVSFDPDGGAAAHSLLSFAIASIDVDDGGTGYSSPPSVDIDAPTGNDGVQATAHAVMGTGSPGPTTETLAFSSSAALNGVLFRLGTNFGAVPWENPHTEGRCVVVRSDHGAGSSTDMAGLVDRATEFDQYSTDTAGSWIAVDLGEDRSLVVAKYTLQNRDFADRAIRNWRLQGSNNGGDNSVGDLAAATWFDIDIKEPNSDMAPVANQFASYDPSEGNINDYRWIRVIQTGLNSSGDNYLTLAEIELYGEFAYLGTNIPVDSVASIVIDDPGFGYLVIPNVSFMGDGTDAAATTVLETLGSIDSVIIDDPGMFEAVPDVDFGSGAAVATAVLESAGSVIRVDITNAGTNYQGAPGVTFDPVGADPGAGASAIAEIEGPVTGFTVTVGGAGYETAPGVNIPGGAAATAIVAGGEVTSLTLDAGGSGYSEPPPVVFAPLGGPEGEATIGFGIDHITVNNGGSGYPSAPPVDIVGDGQSASAYSILGRSLLRVEIINPGSGYGSTVHGSVDAPGGAAGATVTVQRKFGIESATVTTPGSGYTSDPLITAPSPEGIDAIFLPLRGLPLLVVVITNGGGNYTSAPTANFAAPFGAGTTATGTAFVGFGVASVAMDSMGSGYTSAPNVEIRSSDGTGGGAIAIAELLGRTLASVFVDAGGSGYTSAPTVVVGDGSSATAHAVLTGDVVTSIVIDDAGSGYLSAPEIHILGDGGGTGAHAVGILSAGQDIRIVVTNAGSGYEAAPDVIITVGGGTGAAATATLDVNGVVKRVELTLLGSNYIEDPIIAFSSGGGAGAAAHGIRDLNAAGTIALIAVTQAGDGYVATTINLVISGGGGSGAAGTATKKTLGSIKSVTVTNVGSGFVDPPIIHIAENLGGVGIDAIARAILAATGRVKSVVITSAGQRYTEPPDISFPASIGSGATATAFLTATGSIRTLTLTVPGGPFTVAPLVSFLPTGSVPLATALYLLPQIWPTLTDKATDPTDKLIVIVVKDIVEYGTALPPGYSETKALNKYRTIQMVSSIDRDHLPPVERYLTTQNVALPNLLTGVLPVWSTRTAENHSVDGRGTSGDAGATAEISGTILVLKKGGFRGAATAIVERTHFPGIPPDSSIPPITIIRPSSGTAFLKGGSNRVTREGALVGQVLNIHGQPAQIGGIIGYNSDGTPLIFSGGIDPSFGIKTGSSSDVSSNAQIVDINDVLTAGIIAASVNGVEQRTGAGNAHALDVRAAVQGTFGVNIPASCPASFTPGSLILQEVGVEKRRFDVYVRTIVYVIVPGDCSAVGQYGPQT